VGILCVPGKVLVHDSNQRFKLDKSVTKNSYVSDFNNFYKSLFAATWLGVGIQPTTAIMISSVQAEPPTNPQRAARLSRRLSSLAATDIRIDSLGTVVSLLQALLLPH